MALIIISRQQFDLSGSGSGSGSSADGHSHSNSNVLNKLSADSKGNLTYNGKIVGEKSIETAFNIILTETQVRQKCIALPDDCDTSKIVTLSLNGVAMPEGDFWEVRENVNSTSNDLIAWEGLGLDNLVQVGDTVLISYYKKI